MPDRFADDLPNLASAVGRKRRSERAPAAGQVTLIWLDDEETERRSGATILDVSANGYGLLVSQPISSGRTAILVDPAGERRKIVVCHCEPHDGGWRLGAVWITYERRREDRTPVRGPARLRLSARATGSEADVEVVDVSSGGIRLDSPIEAPRGELARVVGEEFECVGRVSNCQPHENRYRIGIQFVSEPIEYARVHSEEWID